MTPEPPRLEDTGNGTTVHYKGRYLYSSRDPLAGPLKLAKETALLPKTLVFVPSFGLGHGIPELLEKLPPESHILCVERDQTLLRRGLEFAEKAAWFSDGRFSLVRADSTGFVRDFFREHPVFRFRRVTALMLCGGARLYPEFYHQAEEALKTEIRHYWQNRMTLIHLGNLYVKNLFANTALFPQTGDLSSLALDRPVLVAGAGPSLEQSLPLIRKILDRVAVLATDTALPALLLNGIEPEYVFALEPQFINIRDFRALPQRPFTLVADCASSPQVLRLCLRNDHCHVLLFSSRFAELPLLDRMRAARLLPCPIPALGSVGVAAVYAALAMTRAPVLLAGLDFSYPGFRTYARGTPFPQSELENAGRSTPVGHAGFAFLAGRHCIALRDKRGKSVSSDLVLSSYAENVRVLCRQNRRVFDLNPEGLENGAPLLQTENEVQEALGGFAPVPQTKSHARDFNPSGESVRNFLMKERTLLLEGIRGIENVLKRKKNAKDADDKERPIIDGKMAPFLGEIAHAFCHLPAAPGTDSLSRSSLAQILYFSRMFSERIDRALSLTT